MVCYKVKLKNGGNKASTIRSLSLPNESDVSYTVFIDGFV